MGKKIRDLLLKNLGLKILAAVLSIALWFFVVRVNDPDQTRTFTVPVTVANAEILEETGEYYTVDESTSTVQFQATAKRSVIERMSSSDFNAIADMNYLDRANSRIPIDITVSRFVSQVTISTRARYLNVYIGEKQEAKFIISGKAQGKPADGYALQEIVVSPNVVKVSGPSEAISKINTVIASVDVGGMISDVTESVVPVFLDSDGVPVDMTGIETNVNTVEVHAAIRSVKTVPIKVTPGGELPEGMTLGGITTDPSVISIVGDSAILNNITGITIPDTVIDLSTLTGDIETTVDISSYLPDGVSVLEGGNGTVKIDVDVIAVTDNTFEVPSANITLKNVSDGMSAEISDETVSAVISGREDALQSLQAGNITGSIDCSGLSPGSHKVNVELNLDDGFTAQTVTTDVIITEGAGGASAVNGEE